MYAVKTFKGVQLDLQHFKGATIREYEMEFLEDDCTAMDLSIYTDIQIVLRHKRGGTVINTYSILNGGVTFSSSGPNFIKWTVDFNDFSDLPRLEYYHESFGILGNSQKDSLFYGVSDIV